VCVCIHVLTAAGRDNVSSSPAGFCHNARADISRRRRRRRRHDDPLPSACPHGARVFPSDRSLETIVRRPAADYYYYYYYYI